jgi:hypothetical protein
MKEKILSYVFATVLVLLATSLLIIVANVAVERSENVACAKLAKQEKMYEGFFYSDSERIMCNIK